ncbi:MAG: hypothetical protein C3F07_12385 [Anaerolineales bacterium]|nr:hypothetical protein [Anaerolineae bacterium]PWB72162.1 MAG: hypothetical protein C3F07_12385 [Anaerolineales bacterium]
MNRKMKDLILVLMIALLLAACGGTETPSAPVVAVTEEPTSVPEPVEDTPAPLPTDVPDSEQFSQYIGLTYSSLPEGLALVFSMLIQNKEGYGLTMVQEGGNKMLWLGRITGYDAGGSPLWEVKDVLGLSDLETGLTLIPDGCFLNGVPDSGIIVAARNGVIRFAWRIDTVLDKFETMPANGVTCNSDKAVSL